MAWVETRVTRTSQPQDACGIDCSNPITRGLVFAFNPATGAANLADGKAATTNNTSRRASPDGVFAKGAASQRNIEWANYQPVTTSDGNGTGDFTLVSFSNPPLASGGVSQHIFAQKNDAGGSPFAQVQLAAHYNFTVGAHEEGKFTFAIYSPAGNQIAETPFSIDGNWHMWSGVRSGATMTLRRDVEVLSSTTSAVRSILQAAPRYLALGGQGNTTASALTEGVGYSFAFNRALSDAEIQSLSANPWQVFAPEIVRIWVDDYVSAGGGATVIPIGVQATGSVGTPSVTGAANALPAGVSATASVGTPVAVGGASIAATALPVGVAASSAVGAPIAIGAAVAKPAGVSASSAVGVPVAIAGTSIPATVLPTGVQAFGAVGTPTVTAAAIAQPLGVAAIAYVGTPTIATGVSGVAVAYPAGVQAIGQVGALIATGAAWTAAVGVQAVASVGTPSAYAGIQVIYTPGAQTRPSRIQSSSRPSRIQSSSRPSRLQTGTRASR